MYLTVIKETKEVKDPATEKGPASSHSTSTFEVRFWLCILNMELLGKSLH